MTEPILEDRRKALEEEFFRKRDEKLLERLRSEQVHRESKEELSKASGIKDDALLEKVLGLGIRARTLAPLSLVPLVEVAWADGKMDAREEEAILQAATASGLSPDSPGYALLEEWFDERPEPGLREVWLQYTRALCKTLSEDDRNHLKEDLLGRARKVAEAAGGFLGIGDKVSRAEDAVLQELEKAFD